MINPILKSNIAFKCAYGKPETKVKTEDGKETEIHVISPENYAAYGIKRESNELQRCFLEKICFGYGVADKSKPPEEYTGPTDIGAGFSTEPEYGGSYLTGNINTPLSTKGVHDCAVLNLVNEDTGTQLLYHVASGTNFNKIKSFVKEKFPDFTKANIMPGDTIYTKDTVDNIITAVSSLNPKAEKHYYYMPVQNPEIVAYEGRLNYIEGKKDMTFTEVNDLYVS